MSGTRTQPRITVVDDAHALARAAAERFVTIARESVAARGRFRVALSGGSTPRAMFRLLASEPMRSEVSWADVDVFWSDERTVPPDSPRSNYCMACDTLISRVPIPDDNVHRMRGEATDPRRSADDYERELRRVFGLGPDGIPDFDLMLLGIGGDGHTASLFPNTDALRERNRLVVANAVPQLQTARLTLTVPVLNASRYVLVLASGESKAQAVSQAIDGQWDPTETPSQYLRDAVGEVEWLLDHAAASRLGSE
jgi:6-phosphogluconolactonase